MSLCYTDVLQCKDLEGEVWEISCSADCPVGGAGGGQDYPALTYNHPHPDQFIQTHYSHYTPLG